MTPTRSRRSDACLSDLQLDTLLAGQGLPHEEEARAHLASCDRCRTRHSSLEDERRAFLASHASFTPRAPLLSLPSPSPSPSRPRKWPLRIAQGAALLGLAACLLIALRRPTTDEPPPTERPKGGSTFGFYVKHGESVIRGTDEQVVHPGDLLRFVVQSPKPHFALLSVDGARAVSVYFPSEAHTEAVDARQELALPQSIRLDRVLGPETLYGVFCDGPTDLGPLRERLRADPSTTPVVPGCEVRTLAIRKDPP